MYNADGSPEYFKIQFYDDIYKSGSKFQGSLSGELLMQIKYDSRGNWTKKTRLIRPEGGGEAQPYSAEQRVITYY